MQLENTIEDLWVQFQTALKQYNDATEERKRAFEDLKNKDEKSSREIDTQMRRIQRLTVCVILIWTLVLSIFMGVLILHYSFAPISLVEGVSIHIIEKMTCWKVFMIVDFKQEVCYVYLKPIYIWMIKLCLMYQ